jgi:hypothetical protein
MPAHADVPDCSVQSAPSGRTTALSVAAHVARPNQGQRVGNDPGAHRQYVGVRREGVNEAAARLQKLGALLYRRGRITVLDRPMLERLCCECYAVVGNETARVLQLPM